MILPRYRHALAAAGGRLYACGGQKIDGRATASVERYDPTTDTWQEVAPMGRPRFSHAVAELDGMLCARAHRRPRLVSPAQLTSLTSLLLASGAPRADVPIFPPRGPADVVGGFAAGNWLSAVERYDPVEDVWEDLSDLETPISAPGLAVC
jgi:hypothetical protein